MRSRLCGCYREARCAHGVNLTDDLELLITAMVREKAHHHQCSLAAATRQIRGLVAEAREEYRAAGAPYGDHDQGFCRHLLARGRLTLTA